MITNIEQIENKLTDIYAKIDRIAFENQTRILNAFRELKISNSCFYGTTGYGYDDKGRDTLNLLYAKIFGTESAFVSPHLTCASHALSACLYGLLRPNDCMLSITGKPYDTLDDVIFGKEGEDIGSLKDFNISYYECDIFKCSFDKVKELILQKKPKLIFIQRSRGYNWSTGLTATQIVELCKKIKQITDAYIMIDNCYGELVDSFEPSEYADILAGSLIKNIGGGICGNGAYIVGTKKAVEQVCAHITSPALLNEVGSFERGYREFYQGLFIAPHTVANALKGMLLVGEVMKEKGYEILPKSNELPNDIIKSIKFDTAEKLVEFVQMVQKYSPIDSDAVPMPWDMPGYTDQIIMAAGTFVGGASIELSCDAPIKSPYIAYIQGGLTYEHCKILANEFDNKF